MKKYVRSLDLQYAQEVEWRQPDRYRHLFALAKNGKLAVQGAGLSIAACSFGQASAVINMLRFNRILGFDGANETVEVEAGCTLAKLHTFLMPRGYWLAVQPGYPDLTVGGCIADNVHGKSHYRDGSFDRYVVSLKLFHPDRGVVTLSPTEEPAAFELTLGGFGLTGVILSAVIRVQRIRANAIRLKHVRVRGLPDTLDTLSQFKESHDFLYSWNDLSRFDSRLGQGFVVAGLLAQHDEELPQPRRSGWIDPNRWKLPLPLLNRLTLPLANRIYATLNRGERERVSDIEAGLFPWLTKTFYFESFGRTGVIEPQILVPDETAPSMVAEFESLVRRHRQPFAVASFKLFRGERKLLRFDGSGVSFSLQIPATRGTRALCEELDGIATAHGAITNLIKDSRLSRTTARAQYPQFDLFAERLRAMDPKRVFSTAVSERLGL